LEEYTQANDKIISKLEEMLNDRKYEGTEDGVENMATVTIESLTGKGGVDI
jgi:hypothetical protein